MISMVPRRVSIKSKNIIPCDRMVCLCVEYLTLSKKEDYETYKHCMITNVNNKKYETRYGVSKDDHLRAKKKRNAVDKIFEMMKDSEKAAAPFDYWATVSK